MILSWGDRYLQEIAADSGGDQHGDDHPAKEENVVGSGPWMEPAPSAGQARAGERAPGVSLFPVGLPPSHLNTGR